MMETTTWQKTTSEKGWMYSLRRALDTFQRNSSHLGIVEDRKIALNAVEEHGLILNFCAQDLRDDFEIVSAAIAQSKGWALCFASDRLQNSKDLVKAALFRNGLTLQYASEDLKKDKGLVLLAVSECGCALQFASRKLRQDREVVLKAVSQNGRALQYASDELKGDLGVVWKAILQNPSALDFCHVEFVVHLAKLGLEVVHRAR